MKLLRHAVAILFAVLALGGCATQAPPAGGAQRAAATDPKALLFVGNSFYYYNNSMHGHLGQLLTGAGRTGYRSTSATISGSGLNWHDMESYFKPGGMASYSFVGDNEVRFNTFDRPFDVVLMMDCSQCPIHPKLASLFHETVKKDSEIVRRHGAQPTLFMSWAYADKPEMTELLAAEYIRAGKDNDALVVPAGYAFANSLQKRPDIALHVADKRHPTLAGTYLAACTIMASLYKVNPVGNRYTAGLPPDVAAHLQATAWETAQAFHAKEGRGSLR